MNQAIIEQKKQIIQEILEKIEKAQSVVLVDYRGLNVEEVSELRNKYREAGVEYKVYKNNMMKFAFKEAGLEAFNEYLKGPSAIAFSMEDAVSAAKVTSEFAKANDKLEIKAGIVDGDIIDVEGVKALASIPSREVLIAKVLGGLNAPISGFANVLQGNMRNLVYALNQIAEQKQA
ncbi:LSU ribosomal protein L10P [Dethiosulfatibacter aminovorans DSM 17477]|uniref:Large ribosomal subunit protein uL10 n=1 Tax=Dethiosulfatibacter aminovorans DSM 17477 TaxID=1121476 RepID=A0A1M6MMU6_9FIRM|nr:50S ribosomal protein L10 [Dethiosulfatibacter aminovorans]SHJ84787.1 LSU ribosomal protein L10P [Dethiosulfatibacter aminovorans DSM 17477]